jgi:hypothetical protein
MIKAIRLTDLSENENICAECKLALMAIAIEDLAMAHAMLIIHGDDWAQKYIDHGGRIRFDDDDEPVIHFDEHELHTMPDHTNN